MPLETVGESVNGERLRGEERRLRPRFACEGQAEVFVADPGCLFRGEIQDISESGCYIMTSARLKLERLAEVDLQFMVNKQNYQTLARVMFTQPGKGVGLEFLFYDSWEERSFQDSIRRLLKELSPKPV